MYFNIGGHSFVQVKGQFTMQLLSCGFGWKYTKKLNDGHGIVLHIFITLCSTSEIPYCLTDDQWETMFTVRFVLRVLQYIKSNYKINNNNNNNNNNNKNAYQADPKIGPKKIVRYKH